MNEEILKEISKLNKNLNKTNLTPEQKMIIKKIIANEKYILQQKNTNLQNRIDKAIEFAEKERKKENNIIPKNLLDQQWKNGFTSALVQIEDILKGDDEN